MGRSKPDDGFVEGQHPVAALAVLYSSDGLKPDDGFVEGQHPVASLAVLYSSDRLTLMMGSLRGSIRSLRSRYCTHRPPSKS